jgi:L-ascorbate 6-phosphate lactonase
VAAAPSPLERLSATNVPGGGVGLLWLGQAGFVLRTPEATAMIDPFLSPHPGREYESGLAATDADGIDVVLCTHEHVDHLDAGSVPAIAKASPGATFVVPTPIVDLVTDAGIAPERVVGVQPGEPVELAGLSIRALGFVVEAGDVRLYHAGDTIHYPGMETTLRGLEVDVAMLPINGRDPQREARGIVGNLSEREAAWLAAAMGAAVVVPMHYDLFARNRGYPEWLVESLGRDHPGPHALVPARDAPFVVSSGRPR